MSVPMVSLIIVTLLTPIMMQRLSLLPDWGYLNLAVVILLVTSGLSGVVLGRCVCGGCVDVGVSG